MRPLIFFLELLDHTFDVPRGVGVGSVRLLLAIKEQLQREGKWVTKRSVAGETVISHYGEPIVPQYTPNPFLAESEDIGTAGRVLCALRINSRYNNTRR